MTIIASVYTHLILISHLMIMINFVFWNLQSKAHLMIMISSVFWNLQSKDCSFGFRSHVSSFNKESYGPFMYSKHSGMSLNTHPSFSFPLISLHSHPFNLDGTKSPWQVLHVAAFLFKGEKHFNDITPPTHKLILKVSKSYPSWFPIALNLFKGNPIIIPSMPFFLTSSSSKHYPLYLMLVFSVIFMP